MHDKNTLIKHALNEYWRIER